MKADNLSKKQIKIVKRSGKTNQIVQGIAGSGKTTIALYRINYLLKSGYKPENLLLLKTSKLFFDKLKRSTKNISIKSVSQLTYEELVSKITGKKWSLITEKDRLVQIYDKELRNNNTIPDSEMIKKEMILKSSLKYKKYLDDFLNIVIDNLLPNKDFIIANTRILKKEDLRKMFIEEYSNLPFYERMIKIRERIFLKITNHSKTIAESIVTKRSNDIKKLYSSDLDIKLIKQKKAKLISKTEKLLAYIYKKDEKILDSYFNLKRFKNIGVYYKKFVKIFIKTKIKDMDFAEFISKDSSKYVDARVYTYEDLSGLLYLHYKIYGMSKFNDLKHIVIDDAQDMRRISILFTKRNIKRWKFYSFRRH